MTARRALRHAELSLAAVGLAALLLLAIAGIDAVRFHLPELLAGEAALDGHAIALAGLLLVQAVALVRMARSLIRRLRVARRIARLRPAGTMSLAGHEVTVLEDDRPLAFCAGLLRPRVYVSDAAVGRLSPAQLRAVVEHESAHARRRDPLRLLIAHTLVDGFGFVPGVRRLEVRQAAAADLVADAAAVAALGSAQPLAAALLELEAVAPERVDQLLGHPARVPPLALTAGALVSLVPLAALTVAVLAAATDPALPAVLLVALTVPAWLAARRLA